MEIIAALIPVAKSREVAVSETGEMSGGRSHPKRARAPSPAAMKNTNASMIPR